MERLAHRFKATYDPGFHIEMLLDSERVMSYKNALKNVVTPDSVVVDPGTGTGLLALLAAEAGARKVYAIELDDQMYTIAHKNFLLSTHRTKIELIRGDARNIVLPESVDIVVCEMLHSWLVEEAQAPVMLNMRRFLCDGGVMIPSHVENYATLGFVDVNQPGCPILSPFHLWENEAIFPTLLADMILVNKIDLKSFGNLTAACKVMIRIQNSGIANILALESRALMFKDNWLSKTQTLFPTIYLPLPKPILVSKGELLHIEFNFELGARWTEIDTNIIRR